MIYQSHTAELIASIYPKLSHPDRSRFFSKTTFLFPSLNIAKETDTNFQFPVRALP